MSTTEEDRRHNPFAGGRLLARRTAIELLPTPPELDLAVVQKQLPLFASRHIPRLRKDLRQNTKLFLDDRLAKTNGHGGAKPDGHAKCNGRLDALWAQLPAHVKAELLAMAKAEIGADLAAS